MVDSLGPRAAVVTGFVLPKFSAEFGPAFLDEVVKAADRLGRRLFAMPVLETPAMAHLETRREALLRARAGRGAAVVVVTHSPAVSAAADRAVALLDGRVVDGAVLDRGSRP